jgi:hypothetical protein
MPEDVAQTTRTALADTSADPLYSGANCGMVAIAAEVARAKLTALAAGVELAQGDLPLSLWERVGVRGGARPYLPLSRSRIACAWVSCSSKYAGPSTPWT